MGLGRLIARNELPPFDFLTLPEEADCVLLSVILANDFTTSVAVVLVAARKLNIYTHTRTHTHIYTYKSSTILIFML